MAAPTPLASAVAPCKHKCLDKFSCMHACCKRGIGIAQVASTAAPQQDSSSAVPEQTMLPLFIPEWMTDIKDQVYHTLHHGMTSKCQAGDYDSAFADAESLLLNADLPLLLIARCCMILSCNDDLPDYVGYARHAVKVIDKDIRELLADHPRARFPQLQLDEARRLLAEAESHHASDSRDHPHDEEAEEEAEEEGIDTSDAGEEDEGGISGEGPRGSVQALAEGPKSPEKSADV